MYNIYALFAATVSKVDPGGLPNQHGAGEDDITTILAIVFNIIGALAVLMIVISGLRYITSAGDPQKASQAKDGIIAALAGVAIALTARAIVAFVAGNL
jgi:hypothetical protein